MSLPLDHSVPPVIPAKGIFQKPLRFGHRDNLPILKGLNVNSRR